MAYNIESQHQQLIKYIHTSNEKFWAFCESIFDLNINNENNNNNKKKYTQLGTAFV